MRCLLLVSGLCVFTLLASPLFAWKFKTHRDSVIRAFEYMEAPKAPELSKWSARLIKRIGGPEIHFRMGDKNGNTDVFGDTKIGTWWSGHDTELSLSGETINFTGLWHFITMYRPGKNGNAYDGFSIGHALPGSPGGNNHLLRSLLHNRRISDRGFPGLMISIPMDSSGVREAYRFRYREKGGRRFYSTTASSNYNAFQDTVFEPCSNAAAFWYDQALKGVSIRTAGIQHLDYLAHAMHMANDATVTHHVWNTLDHFHDSYEYWVNENVESLYRPVKVKELLDRFLREKGLTAERGLESITIQEIVIYFAGLSFNMPDPLYSESLEVRTRYGTAQYNASIAANILMMIKYVLDLHREEDLRRY